MGKIEDFRIVLEKSDGIYMPGEQVTGTVIIKVTERLKVNTVLLKIRGRAHVQWSEDDIEFRNQAGRSHAKQKSVKHKSTVNYINLTLALVPKSSTDDVYLETGDLVYPFEVPLPVDIPANFEHTIGYVRYYIASTIDIPWAFDKHTMRSISVIHHIDLNTHKKAAALRKPVGVEGEKTFGFMCCTSAPATVQFYLSKTGFVPGEAVLFDLNIDNASSSELNQLIVALVQQVHFRIPGNGKKKSMTKTVRSVIASCELPNKVAAKSNAKFKALSFVIPAVYPTSSNDSCKLIDVDYLINLEFGKTGLSFNEDVEIPIIIGTIPLRSKSSNQQVPFTFEPVGTSGDSSDLYTEISGGEIFDSDGKTFRSFVPYYKNLSDKELLPEVNPPSKKKKKKKTPEAQQA